jgi:hypothetical protein
MQKTNNYEYLGLLSGTILRDGMQIIVENMITYEMKHIEVKPNETIRAIKERLVGKDTWNTYNLQYDDVSLDDQKTLGEYKIYPRMSLTLSIRTIPEQIEIAPVQVAVESCLPLIWIAKDAPSWRHIRSGVSFMGICQVEGCKAYRDVVAVSMGIGDINVLRLLQDHDIDCPECHNYLQKVDRIVITNCQWTIETKCINDNEIKTMTGETLAQYAHVIDKVALEALGGDALESFIIKTHLEPQWDNIVLKKDP